MSEYGKHSFLDFLIESNALLFGDFTLKSGRKAPYFINAGNFHTGGQLSVLGGFYADCIVRNNIPVQTLFGPAYKGIPLSVACAVALFAEHNVNVDYCFNRAEAKDHGEGGFIVGKKLRDGEKVVIIEDVITAGTAIRQVMPIIKAAADVDVTGLVILVDRMEKGTDGLSATAQVKRDFGIDVYPLVTVLDIIAYLENPSCGVETAEEHAKNMREYLKAYGA